MGGSPLQALCRELAEKDEDQSRPADNLTTIIDIGLELTKPFFELRPLYADPSIEECFWLLTGETAGQAPCLSYWCLTSTAALTVLCLHSKS